uniref:Uncharacterized protein n=1 Tax=Kalanchoe fedtschenkoi TaxID=63787 RepID=A0A7N0VDW6_KALFE
MAASGDKVANGFAEVEAEQELKIADDADDKDEAFEFSFDCGGFPASPVSADVVFHDWRTKQSFRLICPASQEIVEVSEEEAPADVDVDVIANVGAGSSRRETKQLRQLMEVEKELAFSSSSTESDEIEALAPGSYCVRKPETAPEKKGKSTWPSKRWKLRDLLRRVASVHEEKGGEGSSSKTQKETKRHGWLTFMHAGLLGL